MTQSIAGEVRRYRKERGLSGQQLAERCSQLGLEISRATITDLENGRRVSVTVAELLVLAQALAISPLLLVIPLARQDSVEILPGRDVEAWDAARWWRGDGSCLGDDWGDGSPVLVVDESSPVRQVVAHADLVFRWSSTRDALRGMALAASQERNPRQLGRLEAMRDALEDSQRDLRAEIVAHRAAMRQQGLRPPPLPAELESLDPEQAADRLRAAPGSARDQAG